MIAEMPAMIAPEDDDRVVAQVEAVELVEYLADLGIHITRRRVVAVNELALLVRAQWALSRNIGVSP